MLYHAQKSTKLAYNLMKMLQLPQTPYRGSAPGHPDEPPPQILDPLLKHNIHTHSNSTAKTLLYNTKIHTHTVPKKSKPYAILILFHYNSV